MIDLVDELNKAYHGDAWHGNNTLQLLLKANPEKVFTHPIPDAHSIAELVLHLTAWTEETIDRIQGQPAKEPRQGNWPLPTEKSTAEWQSLVKAFKSANEQLINVLSSFDPVCWSHVVADEREEEAVGVNHAQMINGLIQHHAYHSGQIALLLKF